MEAALLCVLDDGSMHVNAPALNHGCVNDGLSHGPVHQHQVPFKLAGGWGALGPWVAGDAGGSVVKHVGGFKVLFVLLDWDLYVGERGLEAGEGGEACFELGGLVNLGFRV